MATFTIAKTGEGTGGRINYTANTGDGATYQCYLYCLTDFQKGHFVWTDTKFGADSKPATNCNPLLKGAGKC